MVNKKDLFDLHQPKIHIQTVELGPHRRRVFTLSKEVVPKKYTPTIWVIASLIVGFYVFATVFDSLFHTVTLAKALFSKTDTISFDTTKAPERLLGSDDVAAETVLLQSTKKGDYYALNSSATPKTSGLSFLVGDLDTGQIILEKNSEMVLPIASVSKLMTAVIVKDSFDQHKQVTVTRSSVNTYGSAGGLIAGEKVLVTDLLYPLLMESSNDAAEVFAEGFGRSSFLKKMNLKAHELGMADTTYSDPSGLTYLNVSTVGDLFLLARFIDQKKPELWDITRIREYAILSHKWQNANHQLAKTSFIGGKNGYTDEALRTTVSLFEIPLKIKGKATKEKKRIVIVVLKSNDREGDIDKLLRYTENNIGFEEEKEDVIEESIAPEPLHPVEPQTR
jgi:D-alanyl-D-alanine carboxypeptidase